MEVGWKGWYMDVCLWWNDRKRVGGRGRALYLWGSAGTGKSTCVEKLIRGYEVYQPVPGSFFFGDYKAADVVLFEEFNWDRFRYNFPQLKRLLEGKSFAVDQKCNDSKTVRVECPVVMVSNDGFVGDAAFSRRCRIICGSSPFWLEEAVLVTAIKEEPVQAVREGAPRRRANKLFRLRVKI
jgi:hypothetical protein